METMNTNTNTNASESISLPAAIAPRELECKPLSFRARAKRSAHAYAFRDDAVELLAIGIAASLKAVKNLQMPIRHSFGTVSVLNIDAQSAISRLTSEGFGVEYLDATTIIITPPIGRKA